MSFLEMIPADKPRRFLAGDWSESERRFRENHCAFMQMIKCVNPQAPPIDHINEENLDKNEEMQVPAATDFSLSIENKNIDDRRDSLNEGVEYKRDETPKDGNAAPKEGKMMDILDELLSGSSQDEPPKVQKETSSQESAGDILDINTKNECSPVVDKKEQPNEDTLPIDEFNHDKFNKVKVYILRIMENVDEQKVENWMDSVVGYSMNLVLDEQRVRPEILADTLVKVQANKDTVHSILLEMVKSVRWMKEAEEFIKTSGASCSKAGSDSKRIGDVRLVFPEFFFLLAKVEATFDLYERTYRHLCNQADAVSRLVTTQQNEMRYKDIFTGRMEGEKQRQLPFEGPYKRVAHTNPEAIPETKVPERNTEGLDSFNKPNPQKDGPKTTGIVDFEF